MSTTREERVFLIPKYIDWSSKYRDHAFTENGKEYYIDGFAREELYPNMVIALYHSDEGIRCGEGGTNFDPAITYWKRLIKPNGSEQDTTD